MVDVDSTLRNAREQSNVMLSRPSVNPCALDNDSIPSDITPDRTISTPSRVQKAFGLVTQRAMPRTDVRLLPLSFLPSHVHDRVDY